MKQMSGADGGDNGVSLERTVVMKEQGAPNAPSARLVLSSGRIFLTFLLLVMLAGALTAPALAMTMSTTPHAQTWEVDGRVNALARTADTIYLGGDFTRVGPVTGPGVTFDANTGKLATTFPSVVTSGDGYGVISACAPDGAGGWYLGGGFTHVESSPHANLAHILANGHVDANWNPNTDGWVSSLVVADSTVYVGGQFASIGGQAHKSLAALDAASGAVKEWNLDLNDNDSGCWVSSLKIVGSTVYVGGGFASIGGQARDNLAALDAASGAVLDWNLDADGPVSALAVTNSTVYVGGDFSHIGGQARNFLAAVDAASGTVQAWDPNADDNKDRYGGNVSALAVANSTVYVGGFFSHIGGQARSGLAAVDAASGAVQAWDPNANDRVNALLVVGSTVYVGGFFSHIGGQARNFLAALDAASGAAQAWNPDANDLVEVLAAAGSTIFAGGTFTSIFRQPRNHLAAVDIASGIATAWNPGADNTVQALAVSGGTVFAGGVFTNVGGQARNFLAALDAVSGSVKNWDPKVSWDPNLSNDGYVKALAVNGSTLYVGGSFTSIGGQGRRNLAALDITSAAATAWNPSANAGPANNPLRSHYDGMVYTLAISGSTVYVGGGFANIGGQPRNYLAALDLVSGAATDWDPKVSDGDYYAVGVLAAAGSTVFAGGRFGAIGGQGDIYGFAALDAATGALKSWSPSCYMGVGALAVSGSTVYVGGGVLYYSGSQECLLSSFDATNGTVTNWNPIIYDNGGGVSSLLAVGSTLYVGGRFGTYGQQQHSNFAQFNLGHTVSFQADDTMGYVNFTTFGATWMDPLQQTVEPGTDCNSVTAYPATGYRFVKWTRDGADYSTANPLLVTNVTGDMTLEAVFAIGSYTVSYQTDGTAGATLSGATTQTAIYGTTCTAVTANAPPGYHFLKWTKTGIDYSTANPLTVTIPAADMTLTAVFSNTFTVSFAYNNMWGASLIGTTPQTVVVGTSATAVTANAHAGYHFVKWTRAGSDYSTANPLTVTNVTADIWLYAEFAPNTYMVAFQTDGTAGATLTGTTPQTADYGAYATPVTANAPAGYHFVKWTRLGADYTTANPLTVTSVAGNMTLTAVFALNTYTVTFQTDGTAGTTLTGTTTQTINPGASTTAVTANAPAGYHFLKWTMDGADYSTVNPLSITNVSGAMTLRAVFAHNLYTVSFATDGTAGATLSGTASQTINPGANATAVTANAPAGYHFLKWTKAGADFSTANPLTITSVTADTALTAVFAINTYTVTFQTNGTAGATLSGTTPQTVNYGSNCTAITANAPTGYHFLKWTKAGADFSTANPLTVTGVTGNMTLTAVFAPNTFTVSFQTDGTAGVTLTGLAAQTVNPGANCTPVTATAPAGYHFVHWTGNRGDTYYANPLTVFGVAADMTLTAVFALNTYSVSFWTDGAPGVSLTGTPEQTIGYGAGSTPVTANAPAGYHFVKWTKDGADFSTANPLALARVTGNMELVAIFVPNPYMVSFKTDGTAGATLTGAAAQTVNYGASSAAVRANAPVGYRFVKWTLNGAGYSTANPLVVTSVSGPLTLAACFEKMRYAVTFRTDGTRGATLTGTAAQTITYGLNATAVKANAPTGYHFVKWTKGGAAYSSANPLTVSRVAANTALTAIYALNTYALAFKTDGTRGATLSGRTAQTVNYGTNALAVRAVAPVGYRFVKWTKNGVSYATANPLSVARVTAALTLTATFEKIKYTVTFKTDGTRGTKLTGTTTQTISYGSNAAAVKAVPPTGYIFVKWTKGATTYSTANPLTVRSVTANLTLVATFKKK